MKQQRSTSQPVIPHSVKWPVSDPASFWPGPLELSDNLSAWLSRFHGLEAVLDKEILNWGEIGQFNSLDRFCSAVLRPTETK